jgi:hypothetical protein
MEKLNSLKNEMNYNTELETIKKHLIITKEDEEECIKLIKNLINKDKNKKLDEIASEYRNLENMMNDDEMDVDDENQNEEEDD